MPKGEKDVYKVSTFHNEIEGTEDHKLLVYENNSLIYKEIKDIKVNDLLIIDNSYNKCNGKVKINKEYPSEKEANLNKTMTWWTNYIDLIPDYVDEEFAEFFGFMLGDGWITQSKYVYFATGEYEKFNIEFAKYIEKITGHKASFKRPFNDENNNYEYSSCLVCSKCLALIMRRMGFIDGFDKKRIPSWVFSSSDTIKKSFLNGLMISDGSYNIDKYNVLRCSLEMANEQLIKDIKTLVQSLGYKSSKISSRNRVGKHTILKNGYNVITKNTSYYFYFYESYNKQEKKYDLFNRLENGFKTEKVRKIEYVGKKQTYDFTVNNENSNFFANGIVTHNCSYLNAARRHWRMLSLMEDMMLIYRLERSIERRVYKIYVGAIDDADVQAYVEQIANNFKRTPIIDPMTGQVDLRKNILSVDQDIFIPVRDQNAPTPIDTLSAAQNLTAMDDIKFVQNKVLTALRIPKSFLNFEEGAGDGKNLALMDIRFTRVINRIQQAFLMELTKVASIHLYLLGFDDDLTNFNLTMNNPSTQAEQLEIDNLQKKISAVRDAVSDPGNGLPVMSQTRALKQIMKWSDKEIKENLEEIRLEKGIAAELEKTTQIIKRTGIFDIVDRIYGEPGAEYQEDAQQGGPDGGMGGGMPGGGGGSFGSDLDNLGAPGGDENGDIMGAEGSEPTGDMGGNEGGNTPPPPGPPPSNESINRKKKLIAENTIKESNIKLDNLFEQYISKIDNRIERTKKPESIIERTDIYDKSLLINEEFSKMIDSLNIISNEEETDE
jgi:intein/homing endonuclease